MNASQNLFQFVINISHIDGLQLLMIDLSKFKTCLRQTTGKVLAMDLYSKENRNKLANIDGWINEWKAFEKKHNRSKPEK